jgi:uncharacterized membrane protein
MIIIGRFCHSAQLLFAVALFISTWFYIDGFTETMNGFLMALIDNGDTAVDVMP